MKSTFCRNKQKWALKFCFEYWMKPLCSTLSNLDISCYNSLGAGHDDGSDECPNGANIMSTYVPSGKACFTWSNCSRRWVQDYLR